MTFEGEVHGPLLRCFSVPSPWGKRQVVGDAAQSPALLRSLLFFQGSQFQSSSRFLELREGEPCGPDSEEALAGFGTVHGMVTGSGESAHLTGIIRWGAIPPRNSIRESLPTIA